MTTERLSTGKKVASTIDNHTHFFATSNYNSRADALTSRINAMSEATEMINAADNGITTIKSYLSQMKGVVSIQSAGTNGAAGGRFRTRRPGLAYNSFTLTALTPTGDIKTSLSSSGLPNNLQAYLTNVAGGPVTCNYVSSTSDVNISYAGDNYTAMDHSWHGNFDLVTRLGGDPIVANATNVVANAVWAVDDPAIQSTCAKNYDTFVTNLNKVSPPGGGWSVDWSGSDYQDSLTKVTGQIEGVENSFQTQSNNLAIITQREDYTNKSIDILNNGADDRTLADLNEEGTNLRSLQTSQSLAVQALSLSSSSAANVLNIIR
jgi:hypothetical protein